MGYKPLRQRPRYKKQSVDGHQYDSGWEVLHAHLMQSRGYRARREHDVAVRYWNPLKGRWATYYPDFVVDMDHDQHIVQEVKPLEHRARADVLAKAQAARAYCRRRSAQSGEQWTYTLVLPGELFGTEEGARHV